MTDTQKTASTSSSATAGSDLRNMPRWKWVAIGCAAAFPVARLYEQDQLLWILPVLHL